MLLARVAAAAGGLEQDLLLETQLINEDEGWAGAFVVVGLSRVHTELSPSHLKVRYMSDEALFYCSPVVGSRIDPRT